MLRAIRRLLLPVCDLVTETVYGHSRAVTGYFPRHWLLGRWPVWTNRRAFRTRYDLAIQLIERDRMK